jgi:cytidylate kinase
MSSHLHIETGLSVLEARLRNPQAGQLQCSAEVRPFVTFGHETAAGASTVGRLLVSLLDESFREEGQGWVFLDKDLLSHVLATHHLPEHLASYLPEDKVSEIKSVIGELVGLHPSLWELEHKVSEAIMQLAYLGHVVIAGRAAYLITQSLAGGFHVRLVASPEVRIERMMHLLHCSASVAATRVRETDHARQRFVRTRFGQDLDDPHIYDLVINTDRMTPMAVARLIVDSLRNRMQELKEAAQSGSMSPFVVRAGQY